MFVSEQVVNTLISVLQSPWLVLSGGGYPLVWSCPEEVPPGLVLSGEGEYPLVWSCLGVLLVLSEEVSPHLVLSRVEREYPWSCLGEGVPLVRSCLGGGGAGSDPWSGLVQGNPWTGPGPVPWSCLGVSHPP